MCQESQVAMMYCHLNEISIGVDVAHKCLQESLFETCMDRSTKFCNKLDQTCEWGIVAGGYNCALNLF